MTAPAITEAMEPNRSASTCARAPSMLRLRRSARDSDHAAAMFTTAPAAPMTMTMPPSTSGGSASRPIALIASTPASTSSAAPLIWALRTSARPRPNVNAPRAGRAASAAATSARPSAPASVTMCAASESNARDPATMPATTSTTMKPAMSASAVHSQRRSAFGSIRPCS